MLNNEGFINYLLSVRQITRAETVSLLLSSTNSPQPDILLLHEGPLEPLPEFASKDEALASTKELNGRSNIKTLLGSTLIITWKSAFVKGFLLRFNYNLYLQGLKKSRNLPSLSERREANLNMGHIENVGEFWLGLNYGTRPLPEFIDVLAENTDAHCFESPDASVDWLVHSLCQGGLLVWQTFKFSYFFKDPTSLLPGRMEFQASLKKVMLEAGYAPSVVGLILINPDEFAAINQRLGRDKGDQTLTEVGERLFSLLRRNDLVFRYGGAMFALILQNTTKLKVTMLINKIRSTLTGTYLNAAARLNFSVGAAIHEADSNDDLHESILKLVKQADQALNLAKVSGGGKSIIWDKTNANDSVLSLDRLGNIFTSETEKDYRNMLLLWDTIAIISAGTDAQIIASQFIERVKHTLKPFRIGLFEEKNETTLRPLVTSYGEETGLEIPGPEWILSTKQKKLLDAIKQGSKTERIRFLDKSKVNRKEIKFVAYGFSLLVKDQIIGYLYIDGPDKIFTLDSSDLAFLTALSSQLAMALDRAALTLLWQEEKEKESRLLRQEVRQLRQVLHSAKFIYRSEQMQSLLEMLSSVAPTDVTILITGESGTGKEMLARAIHEQSQRKNKPLITVDCGAIAHTLIEAELFGYEKGAYTGAENSSPGRIMQSEGGSLFLDEIGELPLDVQAKLLRFVQEKEICPVGGGKTKTVDVRIIAATNRDLTEEVAAGRFRGDLYYRLQVITLKAPPLRERTDDIIPLARHFLEKFAVQYEKGVLNLSVEAETALLAYPWPGNIRELQNTIIRAVVIAKKESIGMEELNLNLRGLSKPAETFHHPGHQVFSSLTYNAMPVGGVQLTDQQLVAGQSQMETSKDICKRLRESLITMIQTVLEADQAVPLGRWLTEDLVLAADRIEKGVARRAALRLGLAETTFRRQLEKLKRAEQAGVLSRTPDWANIRPILNEFAASADEIASENMIEQIRTMLLQEIIKRIPKDKSTGSALMGISLPTYQRRLESLHD